MTGQRGASGTSQRGALATGLRTLELLVSSHNPLGVTEIAEQLELDKANAHRTLAALVRLGYVEQDPSTRRYSATVKVVELARSVLLQAMSSVDDAPEQVPLLASLAKARLNELVKLVTNEAVQMHGGIGVTDDLDIGLFLKRARVAMQVFGDTGYHKDRYATLCGY